MPLKNYTTAIPVEKTIIEIESILSKHGVTDIHKQYDGFGNIMAITFGIGTDRGFIPFRLPARADAIRQILMEEKAKRQLVISKKTASDISHARRVTWRIIKDWVDAQVALIDMNMVKVEEVFMPYMLNSRTNETLFQIFEREGIHKILPEKVGGK